MFKYFESLVSPFPLKHPVQPPSNLIKFCLHYTKGIGHLLIIMACLTAMISVLEVTLFGFLGKLVDWLSSRTPETLWQQEGATLVTLGVVIVVILPLTVFLHATVIHQALLGNYPMRIRWQAHRYLLSQSLSFYQNDFAGRIATKVMQTAISVRETVMKLLDVLLFVCIYFIGMIVVVASSDIRLSVPLFIWLIGYSLTLKYFIPRLREVSTRQANARSKMVGSVVDSYTNIETVKLFSHSQREADYAKDSMDGFLQTVHPQMRLATRLNTSVWALNSLLIFSISALSIWLWAEQAITTGAIATAIALALRLNGMSQWIMWEVSSLFENIGTVQDGINTLSKPRQVIDIPTAKNIGPVAGNIDFNNISFHYDQHKPVINKLSLHINAGEKIGLVGRSGAGKSTLVNLMLRFYDLSSGEITIDGVDISQITQESLRKEIGMVTQDTSLLHRSVRSNILYGRPNASEAQMIKAAKQAEAHNFILGLSDLAGRTGYDAMVGERGVKLSGGQRQRIALARVLLKDAPILLLDEATSALDSEIESAIQASLYRLMEGKTVIAIAHRLSTIASLDRLVVIDEGEIIEQGTHAQLLEDKGLYAQLWNRQSGGFIGE